MTLPAIIITVICIVFPFFIFERFSDLDVARHGWWGLGPHLKDRDVD
jgi:hypothetical protein